MKVPDSVLKKQKTQAKIAAEADKAAKAEAEKKAADQGTINS